MCIQRSLFPFVKNSSNTIVTIAVAILSLTMVIPSVRADLIIEYELIARTGDTPVPGSGGGTFDTLSGEPAIDDEGNVAFSGGGGGKKGIYTHTGAELQIVADNDTLIPGGGGATFTAFFGAASVDIDDGRVAFKAINQFSDHALYTNVGQASPADLVEVEAIDGDEWASGGFPWVDGDVVAMAGERLIPSLHDALVMWDGPTYSSEYIDPGAEFDFAGVVQASISGAAAIFPRIDPNVYEIGISSGGEFETLAVADVTPIPGLGGALFNGFSRSAVIDRGGLDVAFFSTGTGGSRAVIKRVNGGALQNVADTTTVMPGSLGQVITAFNESGVALANGHVAFNALRGFFEGIYTDIGGVLSVIVDNEDYGLIELDGRLEEIVDLQLGTRGFALTPVGYMLAFRANLATGETAIIRARITDSDDGLPGLAEGSPPMEDFEGGNADGWLLNGDVAIDGNLAMGQYSLRHSNGATSMLSVSTAGYKDISVTMHLAATSLKKRDGCFAEVSTDGGISWLPVIEVHDGNDDGTFYSGTVYPPGADDNSDLQLRFRASGKGKKGNCYGDDVTVLGTPVGGVESAP